ncbi:MAG: ABC transporter ATP-binding protein [Lachnospiraceae bacterium]|nr:ABC transporter ATP-binding protein [Lachnospiraceae bacterium]
MSTTVLKEREYGRTFPADVAYNSPPYIEISHLSKTFPKQTEKDKSKKSEEFKVLEDINFSVFRGEFICIVGGSGCGKSTFLRAMAGLDPAYSGSIQIDGQKVTAPKKERGMVFQEPRLFPWLSVEDNVIFALNEGSTAEKKQKAQECIDLVELTGFEKSLPKELSGGMAQRANIARALVNKPDILFLDEPFGALDAFTKIQLQNVLFDIKRKEKSTMIMVTHDIEEAVYLADRILVMDKNPGRIREIVTVDLPRPRNRNDYNFIRLRKQVYSFFFQGKEVQEEYNI